MSERARLAAIHEGRTPGPWVERDARAIAAWERTYGPLLDLWHEASWLVGIWADSIQRGSALREDILALRDALEAAAKEVPDA